MLVKTRWRRPLFLLLAFTLFASVMMPMTAFAWVPYDTNYKDGFGQLVWTQSAYTPVEVLGREIYVPDPKDPAKQVFSPLVQPKGIFIDTKDNIYIADTGNNRIVHLDENGNFKRIIDVKENPLKKPEGVFIDKNGDIYVADTGNKRVLRLDSNGKMIREFKRPDSKFLPESFKYDPIKVAVDKRGFLYIATLGGYQGLLQLDPEGNFQSFFGANKTEFSVMDALKRMLYTREMYLREISKLPGSVSSVTIDQNGFIYTVTKEVTNGQIKKLNIAGKDLLATKNDTSATGDAVKTFGEVRFPSRDKLTPKLNDLTVDRNGNITAIDSTLKYVNQYDANGNLLFFWSGDTTASSSKLGVVKTPSAIASNSKNHLYILDEENNVVQVFRLSEFGELVHKANQLTQEGRYEESEKPWQEVLRLNAYYTPAMLGLAKAAYKKGDFERAEKLFYDAGQIQGYSDSFWQIRLMWFQRNFGLLMNIVIIFGVGYLLFERLTRKSGFRKKWRNRQRTRIPLLVQLKHSFYILKHPIDGFSAIRYEGKGGFASSTIMLLLALVSFCIYRAFTNFTFNPSVVLEINLITVFIQFMVLWVGWIVSNYLISTIYRGEGRFRDVAFGSTYALFPIALVGLPLTLLSNVMTLSESAIYSFLQIAMMIWVGLLMFWKVQSMQNYSVGETVMNIFLSLVTMTILGVLIFITFGLSSEMKDFFYSIYQEVTIR
ncbi:SMP-30/gluconolactonase/LRE family protein [Paenibacillus sp. OAS669]|uniref:SMP-30/gluconolactonase/LRE family protein n=1 Tax=Paenibacillus sp. OAS669 TaxID=2663821 RepID=UPI001789A21C|nr:SMP-30/gluconolactonase/LRE family protein [Paenibacillus sp. OAS669]MBE1445000.1 sugar lactone lactonase YvrE [Paenibacillus sp. OAS669]